MTPPLFVRGCSKTNTPICFKLDEPLVYPKPAVEVSPGGHNISAVNVVADRRVGVDSAIPLFAQLFQGGHALLPHGWTVCVRVLAEKNPFTVSPMVKDRAASEIVLFERTGHLKFAGGSVQVAGKLVGRFVRHRVGLLEMTPCEVEGLLVPKDILVVNIR